MKSILILLFSFTFISFGQINWISIGPEGGNLNKIVIDPFNHLHIVALPVESTDGGTTWFKSFPLEAVEFQFDPFQSGHYYLIATDGEQFETNYRLLKSIDGGATWTLTLQGPALLHGLTPDRSVSGQLFLLRGNSASSVYTAEVLRSSDSGELWQSIYSVRDSSGFLRPFRAIVLLPDNSSRLVLLKTFGIDTSSNGGATWHSLDTIFVNGISRYVKNYPMVDLAINPATSSKWFARLFSDLLIDSLAFLRSTDSGVHWRSMSGVKVPRPLFIVPPPPNNATPIRFHPTDPDTMFFGSSIGSSFIYRTTNGGITWLRSTDSLTIEEVQDISFVDPQRGVRLSTKGLGMYKLATNISQMVPSNSGIRLHASNDIAIPNQANPLIVSASSFFKVSVSSNWGSSWEQRSSGIYYPEVIGLRISPVAPQRWYAIVIRDITQSALFASTNNGQAWTSISNGIDLDIMPNDSLTLFRQMGGIDKSTNGGTTWARVLNPPPNGRGIPVADPTSGYTQVQRRNNFRSDLSEYFF